MPSYLKNGLLLHRQTLYPLLAKNILQDIHKFLVTHCNKAPETKPDLSALPNPLSAPCWKEGVGKEGITLKHSTI